VWTLLRRKRWSKRRGTLPLCLTRTLSRPPGTKTRSLSLGLSLSRARSGTETGPGVLTGGGERGRAEFGAVEQEAPRLLSPSNSAAQMRERSCKQRVSWQGLPGNQESRGGM